MLSYFKVLKIKIVSDTKISVIYINLYNWRILNFLKTKYSHIIKTFQLFFIKYFQLPVNNQK